MLAALGIEILCITAAEIGENSSFALFGYRNTTGIALGLCVRIYSIYIYYVCYNIGKI